LKIYLETTVPNFLFHDDAPEKQRVTQEFFRWAETSQDEFYVSRAVIDELDLAPEPKRSRMKEALSHLSPQTLDITAEALELAERYVRSGILSPQFYPDALHVALAVCSGIDIVVSWNLKHLVNARRIERFNALNHSSGLPPVRIHTPEEVMEYEEEE